MCIFLAAHLESFAQILRRYLKNRLEDFALTCYHSLYLTVGFKTRIEGLWQIIIKDILTNTFDLRQTWALRSRGYQLHPNFKGRIFFIFHYGFLVEQPSMINPPLHPPKKPL